MTSFLGSKVIWVQDDVNWEVGQYIAIITSAYKDIINDQNEVRQIVAISGKYFLIHLLFRFPTLDGLLLQGY